MGRVKRRRSREGQGRKKKEKNRDGIIGGRNCREGDQEGRCRW